MKIAPVFSSPSFSIPKSSCLKMQLFAPSGLSLARRSSQFAQFRLTLCYTLFTIRKASCRQIFGVHAQLLYAPQQGVTNQGLLSFPPSSILHTHILRASSSSMFLFQKLWTPLCGINLIFTWVVLLMLASFLFRDIPTILRFHLKHS